MEAAIKKQTAFRIARRQRQMCIRDRFKSITLWRQQLKNKQLLG